MVIEREDQMIEVVLEKSRSPMDYLSLIGEAICFVIAGYILFTMRGSKSASYLAIVFLQIGLIFMTLQASIRGDFMGKVLMSSLMMALPVIFYHFLHAFFLEKGNVRTPNRFLGTLYAAIILTTFLRMGFFVTSEAYPYYAINTTITIIVFLSGIGLNIYMMTSLLITYRNMNNAISTLIKTVWISILISFFPFAVLSFLPILLFGKPWVSTLYTSIIVTFFPLSFTYLIATRQLFDIHIVLRRLMLTSLIALIPSLLIVGFNAIIFQNEITIIQATVLFWLILLVFSIVLYGLEYFTTRLERIMFPRKYVLQSALNKIAKSLGAVTSLRELKDIILVDIVSALQVHGGAILFRYKDGNELISEGTIDLVEVEELISMNRVEHPSYLIYEVNSNEEYTSYLIMTRKKTNTLLGLEDVQWLNLIINYLSVSLENVFLIRKLTMKLEQLAAQMPSEQEAQDLTWFRKLLFELQEKERVRIATDIHDTTMQDLFFLKRRLSSILDRYVKADEDKQSMSGLMDYLEVIHSNLRQSCFELYPHLLHEIGLLQTLDKLIEQEQAASAFTIVLSTEKAGAVERCSLDTKRHIFRMVQELLNNAKKHSRAERVDIEFNIVNFTLYVLYKDDGIGFEPLQLNNQNGLFGIGMEQMRTRSLLLSGKLEVESSLGNGVSIQITLPLQEGRVA
jgi:two-component system sensor histidine kinase ComP